MPYKPTMLPPAIALAAEQMRPADYIKWFADVMPKSTAERFWDKVDASGECWLWVGNLYPNGYGYLNVGSEQFKATRFLWQALSGPIPRSLYVCHRCDVRACVRPLHLFLGSHSDNMLDMYAKGRRVMSREGHPDRCQRSRHIRTPENTKIIKAGYRRCLDCDRERIERSRDHLNAQARSYRANQKLRAALRVDGG